MESRRRPRAFQLAPRLRPAELWLNRQRDRWNTRLDNSTCLRVNGEMTPQNKPARIQRTPSCCSNAMSMCPWRRSGPVGRTLELLVQWFRAALVHRQRGHRGETRRQIPISVVRSPETSFFPTAGCHCWKSCHNANSFSPVARDWFPSPQWFTIARQTQRCAELLMTAVVMMEPMGAARCSVGDAPDTENQPETPCRHGLRNGWGAALDQWWR